MLPAAAAVVRSRMCSAGASWMAQALAGFRDRDRILIGGDIPGIRPSHLRAALHELRRHDAVFGPAEDGGFWLVGLSRGRQPNDLFHGVPWSSPRTLAESRTTLPVAWRVGTGSRLCDVDDVEDYRRGLNRR